MISRNRTLKGVQVLISEPGMQKVFASVVKVKDYEIGFILSMWARCNYVERSRRLRVRRCNGTSRGRDYVAISQER